MTQRRRADTSPSSPPKWRHPIGGDWFSLGLSTIQRWYYQAREAKAGPVEVLKRKVRSYENP